MLPGGTDQLYRDVLAAGHRHHVRVEVWSGDGVLLDSLIPQQFQGDPEEGLTFFSGSVNATLTSRVSRQLNLTLPDELYPRKHADLLANFGNEIRAFSGVSLGDGSDVYTWPVFRGKIRTVSKSSDGVFNLYCADRANDVLDVAFSSPQNSNSGNTILAEFQRLIVDALDDATFGDSDTFNKLMQEFTWEFDRGSALDEIARSVAAFWYPLANGEFVMRSIPWTVSSSPVVTLSEGEGGSVLRWTRQRNRDGIYNMVTVTGERLNGDPPVHATSSDNNPLSPTWIDGNFGIRSLVERLQSPSTQGGAQTTADSLLRSYVAPLEEWSLEMVPDASLELGDTVTLEADGESTIQVVTAFTLPLDLSGGMTVSTRSLVTGLP
jgi:hypothetical protein